MTILNPDDAEKKRQSYEQTLLENGVPPKLAAEGALIVTLEDYGASRGEKEQAVATEIWKILTNQEPVHSDKPSTIEKS